MGPTFLSGFVFSVLRVVGSTVVGNNNAVLVGGEGAIGDFSDMEGDSPGEQVTDAEAYGAPGIVWRPLPETEVDGKKMTAEAMALRTPDGLIPLAWRDLRLNRAFPNPKPGDVALVGYGANFLKLGADGRVALATTTDGTPNGKLISIQLKGDDGFIVFGPFGKLTYGPNGFHLLHQSGARIDLGGIGGLPAPLDQLGSYATIAAAIAKLQAATIVLGPDTGVADNVAKATPTSASLTAIASALTATAAALAAINTLAASPDPGQGPLIGPAATATTAAGTALAAAATAIGTAVPLIPSSSTSVT